MITLAALLWLKTRFAEAPDRHRMRAPVLVVIRTVNPKRPRDGYFGADLSRHLLVNRYYGFAR